MNAGSVRADGSTLASSIAVSAGNPLAAAALW